MSILSSASDPVKQPSWDFRPTLRESWRAFERESGERTRCVMGAFLSRYMWDEFATLTFRGRNTPPDECIQRHFERWTWERTCEHAIRLGLASRRVIKWPDDESGKPAVSRLYGPWASAQKHGRQLPVYVAALESGGRYGRRHVHAVIRWPDMMRKTYPPYRVGGALWREQHRGGWSELEAPKSQEHVSRYCGKYLAKPESELIISPSFKAVNLCPSGREDSRHRRPFDAGRAKGAIDAAGSA